MDPMTVNGVKDFSPWDVISIYEFNFFCCPECDGKSRSKQEFINHASISHPQVSQRLLNRWTLQIDLGSTTGCLERVVSVHNST